MSRFHLALVPLALALVAARGPRIPPADPPRWLEEGEQAQFALLDVFTEAGDFDRSLALIHVMRGQGRDEGLLDLYQGIVLRDAGMTADATELLDRAERRLPRDGRVPEARCVLLANDGSVEEALEECRRATRLDPDSASAWNNTGWLLLGLRRDDEAVTALQEAVRIEGAVALYRTNLGLALASVGKDDAAYRTLRTAVRPADAAYNVGTARERVGDSAGATDWYQRALALDAYHTLSQQALARLEEPL
jgi:tetratricopeptide (TPR) repeat protein